MAVVVGCCLSVGNVFLAGCTTVWVYPECGPLLSQRSGSMWGKFGVGGARRRGNEQDIKWI